MTSPIKPWEANSLQNSTHIRKLSASSLRDSPTNTRSTPLLPPLPRNSPMTAMNSSSYMPYSTGYNSLGYGGYGSYGMPHRSSLYNSYGSYGSYGGYNNYNMYGMGSYPGYPSDDAERRFVQYAEESSRNTFANVESIVRAVNSISMMLDNTFFAMTSSFRAVLSVAENFGRLRSMFGHIWYSISVFRLFNWLYRKFMLLIGRKVPKSSASLAWKQAANGAPPAAATPGSSWPTLAFLGVLVSAPYIISKFLPKYEDKSDPSTWKSPGIRAKAAFDFIARGPTELSVQTNDEVVLAPTYVQEEMSLKNSGWAFALSSGRSGIVPLNYLVINKSVQRSNPTIKEEEVPIPRIFNTNNNDTSTSHHKTHTKRVSFGENQIFENVDLDDYVTGKKEIKGVENDTKHETNEKNREDNKENIVANGSTTTRVEIEQAEVKNADSN